MQIFQIFRNKLVRTVKRCGSKLPDQSAELRNNYIKCGIKDLHNNLTLN